jgi:hypothetical protein
VTGWAALSRGTPLPLGAKVVLAWEVVSSFALARWALRRLGIRPAVARLRAVRTARGAVDDPVAAGRRLGRVVRRTLAIVPGDTRCLTQSLVLTRLLAARGVESRIVIGVKPGDAFAAHAWVEHDGVPLLPPGSDGFQELVTL